MSLDLLRQAMLDADFDPPEIIPDGKVHRFKNKGQSNPDCWYVAFAWNGRDGAQHYTIIWNDWHLSGENFQFSTFSGANKQDKELVREQIKKAQKKAEAERESEYESCRKHCLEYLPKLKSGPHPYLESKGISEDRHGLIDGELLIVPIVDDKGVYHGYQRIHADGTKLFRIHTAKKGHFFPIPGSSDTFLVEGFATGITVHQATGATVIVCFDAGNIASVRPLFPEAILAGDNDDAGRAVGTGIFPPGADDDWNDHAQKYGIESVRDALNKEPDAWVRPLGYRDDVYYYTSSSNRQIVPLAATAHTSNNLYALQPEEFWSANYPGAKGAPAWSQIASTLMESCRKRGMYDPRYIRGTGVWLDPAPLINLGNGIFPFKPKSKYAYIVSNQVQKPIKESDPSLLLEILQSIRWKNPSHPKLLAGWLTVAPFSGALQWRPHVWLTGSAGTGKSTIMEYVISPVLGDFKLYTKGNTSEAGIRQTLSHNAMPIIFDEFEQMEGNDFRTKGILDLCRQASSESSGEILKGSAGGKAVQFNPRFCALVSSIRIGLENDADQSRFTILDLDDPDRENFTKLQKLMDGLTPEYCHGLFSRTFNRFNHLQYLIEKHRRALSVNHAARFAQQHAPLLAGWEFLSDESMELETQNQDADHENCLEHLTSSVIIVDLHGQKQRSVQECIDEVVNRGTTSDAIYYKEALERHGIYIVLQVDEASLNISVGNSLLKRIFAGTRWSKGWGKSLSRFPGSKYNRPFRVPNNGKVVKVVTIELAEVTNTI